MASWPVLARQQPGRLPERQYGNPNMLSEAALTAAGIFPSDLRALTAAGFRITHQDTDQLRRLIQPWQTRAFNYYDQLGEIKYAGQFYSRMLSPLRLFAAEMDDNGDWVETENDVAKEQLDRVQDPGGGREGLLGSYGRLMFLVGEGYLFCTKDADSDLEQWEFLSTDELRIQSGVYVRYKAPSMAVQQYHEPSDDDYEPVDAETAVAYRLWRRHPRYSMLADSTLLGVLDLCEELLMLTRAVRARARSRLAGSGILAISEDFSYSPLEATPDEDVQVDPFLADLTAAMMLPIANEGTASAVVPLVVRGPTDAVTNGIKHIPIIDQAQFYPETGLRNECIDRIAIGLDMPPEILKGLADANHWCQSGDTEILAKGRGWISHADLTVGDEVYTLNHESGTGEWQPVKEIYRAEVEGEILYSMDSQGHSSLSTPEHRWPIVKTGYRVGGSRRRWTTSAEGFASTDRVPVAAALGSETAAIHHDDFVRLVVAFTADGTIQKHKNIRIAKFADNEIAEMRRILSTLFGKDGFREHLHPTRSVDGVAFILRQAEARTVLAVCDENRAVHLSFVDELTDEQRQLFLRSCDEIGDGVVRDGTATLYQVDPSRLDAFAYAAHLSGFKVTYGKRNKQTGFGDEPLSWIHWSTSCLTFTPYVCKQSLRVYTGVVWCPRTENRTWLARRRGKVYFTGNSAWNIDEQTWKAHGLPIANALVNDLTAAFFRPTLKDLGVKEWWRYSIQYDPANVINHPDRTKDARDAFDRLIISKEAYRRIANFAEDDEMPEDERAEQIGIKVRDPSLAWFGIPSPRGGALEPQPGEIINAQGSDKSSPGPTTGSEVEQAAPTHGETDATSQNERDLTGGAAHGNGRVDETTARILGAADLAVFRAREAAGAMIRTRCRRSPELEALIDGVAARDIAPLLGVDRVRSLGYTEMQLVSAGHALIRDALRLGQFRAATAEMIADRVQKHAARTLYESSPVPLPPQFVAYVAGAVASEK